MGSIDFILGCFAVIARLIVALLRRFPPLNWIFGFIVLGAILEGCKVPDWLIIACMVVTLLIIAAWRSSRFNKHTGG